MRTERLVLLARDDGGARLSDNGLSASSSLPRSILPPARSKTRYARLPRKADTRFNKHPASVPAYPSHSDKPLSFPSRFTSSSHPTQLASSFSIPSQSDSSFQLVSDLVPPCLISSAQLRLPSATH